MIEDLRQRVAGPVLCPGDDGDDAELAPADTAAVQALLIQAHDATVRRGADAVAHLDGLLEQGVALQEAALDVTSGQEPADPGRFVDDVTRRLAGIGLRPAHGRDDRPWSRPARGVPAPVAGKPHGIALLPAAAMVGGKLRGRET